MTQDTKYLDAYIKYKFNISKVLEKIGFKGWNKVVEWYESEKYKKIIFREETRAVGVEVCDMTILDITPFNKIEALPADRAKIIKIVSVLSNFRKIFLIVKNRK